MRLGEYVYRNNQRVARAGRGGHAFDANGVCIYCSCCTDDGCCQLAAECPKNEPRPDDLTAHIDGVDGAEKMGS